MSENENIIPASGTGLGGALNAIRTLKGRVGEGVIEGSPPPAEQSVIPESLPGQGVIPESPPEAGSEPQYTDKTQGRIHKLANERDQARQWAEKLAADNQRLRDATRGQEAKQNEDAVSAMEAQKEAQLKRLAFKEDFPTDGTDEEQSIWKIRKEAHEVASKQTMEGISAFATMLAPTLARQAQTSRDQEWTAMKSSLGQYGVERGQLEGTVNAILQREPHRSLRSAVFDAMDMQGNLGGTGRSIPNVATPGQGRTEPPATSPAQVTENDQLLDLMNLAREQGGANRQTDSLRTLAEVFNKGRKLSQ
tara:strand:- start:785 stop:1705 length:921 start_codon:yes stop_codon:yes gene_type:complete